MMSSMLTCWWATRRLDRYIDADPSATLPPFEAARLSRHVATCRRCATSLAERRALKAELRNFDARRGVDPAAQARIDETVDRLRSGGTQ